MMPTILADQLSLPETPEAHLPGNDFIVQHLRQDGSFVVMKNGYPYHVTAQDPMFAAVAAAAGHEYPAEPAPQFAALPLTSVSNAQARAALIQAGLFDDVQTLVAAANNPILTTAWEYANTVDRNGVFVTSLKGQLGLTDQQVDDLFVAAAAIQF